MGFLCLTEAELDHTASRRTALRCRLRSAGRRFWLEGEAVFERVAGMSMDTELQKHYALLLGIGSPWEVKTVELENWGEEGGDRAGLQWGQSAQCPECGRACSIHDSAPERTCGIWTRCSLPP